MPTNIAINGFGRIGRCILRALRQSRRDDIRLVGINDTAKPDVSAHLFKYDSTHGVHREDVSATADSLVVGEDEIPYTRKRELTELSWKNVAADVVLECTGRFADADKAMGHLTAGAKKVLISAPAKDAELTVVYGVNHHRLTSDMRIVSNASCTTNCLAPLTKVLHETAGILSGLMNTVHSYTNDQRILDSTHGDLRRARAAAISMIPTKTGAAAAIGLVLPELAGKLSGVSVRVPTINVSLMDITCLLEKSVTAEEVNNAMREAANGALAGILAVNDAPLVSVDFNQRIESSIVDAAQTQTGECNLIKMFSWYDNEWAFANRMLDTAAAMGRAN